MRGGIHYKALPLHSGVEFLGVGAIGGDGAGIVTDGGTPASKPVYLFDAETMKLLKIRWSNSDGHYLFRAINENKKYLIMVRDDEKKYPQLTGYDWVTPDTSLTPAKQLALAEQWYGQ